MSVCLSVTETPQSLRIATIGHWAYRPLSLSTIEPIDHWAYWPSSLSTIEPINHRAYRPSSPSTTEPIDLRSSFVTFKPFSLFRSKLFLNERYFRKLHLEVGRGSFDFLNQEKFHNNHNKSCKIFNLKKLLFNRISLGALDYPPGIQTFRFNFCFKCPWIKLTSKTPLEPRVIRCGSISSIRAWVSVSYHFVK